MTLGEKIQGLRKQHSMSQEQLSAELNISRQAISKWETGESIPDVDNIVQLSHIFGVTTDYILKSNEPLPPRKRVEAEAVTEDSAYPKAPKNHPLPQLFATSQRTYKKMGTVTGAVGVVTLLISSTGRLLSNHATQIISVLGLLLLIQAGILLLMHFFGQKHTFKMLEAGVFFTLAGVVLTCIFGFDVLFPRRHVMDILNFAEVIGFLGIAIFAGSFLGDLVIVLRRSKHTRKAPPKKHETEEIPWEN